MVDFEPLYPGLGDIPQERAGKYEELLDGTTTDEEHAILLDAVQRGQLTGGNAFIDEIERKLARRFKLRGQGRPKKAEK